LQRSLVTATKTRKKQQTELIKLALQAEEDKKRQEREDFLITTIPITFQAAYEPSLYHAAGEDHDDGTSLKNVLSIAVDLSVGIRLLTSKRKRVKSKMLYMSKKITKEL
jgi:hypothetical protein